MPGFFRSWVKKTWSLWTLSTKTTTRQERCYPQPFLRTNFAHWLELSSKRLSSTSLKFRIKESRKSMQVNSGDRFRAASLPALQSARETQTFTVLTSRKTALSSKCSWENSLPYWLPTRVSDSNFQYLRYSQNFTLMPWRVSAVATNAMSCKRVPPSSKLWTIVARGLEKSTSGMTGTYLVSCFNISCILETERKQ
jgi:hypothetical protein